jgi:hypothetical protein
MQSFDGYIIAFVTFCLGVVSAAYGAQIGKSYEARKELLEKMRDWIDEILLELSTLYSQEISEKKKIVDRTDNRLGFGVHWVRWVGIVKGLSSARLLVATNDFIAAVKDFNKRYDAIEKSQDDNLKRKRDLLSLVDAVENRAQVLHAAITQESIQIPFWLARPYWKLSPAVKRATLIVIFIIILLVAGFYFKLL